MLNEDQLSVMWSSIRDNVMSSPTSLISAPSGFGKSTFLKFVSRQENCLYMDGIPKLFDGSIHDNIFLGCEPNFDVRNVLLDIKHSFDEHISNINRVLSTGQRQRIAFLRSFYSRSRIVVYDETLSGCQNELIYNCVRSFLNFHHDASVEKHGIFVLHNVDAFNLFTTHIKLDMVIVP